MKRTPRRRRRTAAEEFCSLVLSCQGLWPGSRFRPSRFENLIEQAIDVRPTDRLHEGVDISGRLGAEIHVVGMLVHVEGEDRRAAGQGVAMVGCPLVDELRAATTRAAPTRSHRRGPCPWKRTRRASVPPTQNHVTAPR